MTCDADDPCAMILLRDSAPYFRNTLLLRAQGFVHFGIGKATCLRILHDVLRREQFALGSVPYSVEGNQKAERMTFSHRLLEILKKDKEKDFRNGLAGNESWFYFEYLHHSAWAISRDEMSEIIKHKIDTEKCLVSIIWSVNGIHSVLGLPKGTTHNSAFFCDWIMPDLVENFCAQDRRKTHEGIVAHLNNACPHSSKWSRSCVERFSARRVPHLAYGPDRRPNDFFLFRYLKIKIAGLAIQRRQELMLTTRETFDKTPNQTLVSVYLSWKSGFT
jgi:hypothetical protein